MRALNQAYLNLVLPLFESKSFRGAASRFRKYEELEKLPLEENRKRQWESLQRLLKYSYENTAFYKRRFDEAGIQPASLLLNSSILRSSILETEAFHQPVERCPIDTQCGCCVPFPACGRGLS